MHPSCQIPEFDQPTGANRSFSIPVRTALSLGEPFWLLLQRVLDSRGLAQILISGRGDLKGVALATGPVAG
jgi:hypothetical protein